MKSKMTQQSIIFEIALPVPLKKNFDYLAPIELKTLAQGSRILVPFGKQKLVGILVGQRHKSSIATDRLKFILEVIDQNQPAILPQIFNLCQFASQYYQHALGEVLETALPVYLRQKKPLLLEEEKTPSNFEFEKNIILNHEQELAVNLIKEKSNQFQCFLLDGVTGSGKTEVYFHVVEHILNQQQQCLILVPEIGLTPQICERLKQRFRTTIATMHSGLTDKERFQSWHLAKSGGANIIVGTRSAIFTPFKNLGLIIVDEEHDASFKQQDGFRYSARDLAVVRAQMQNIPIILGSATPSLETLFNAKQQRYQHLQLTKRAGDAIPPQFHSLDIRGEKLKKGFSKRLIEAMQTHLSQGNQILLFLNRRGYAPLLMCHDCGWMLKCTRCEKSLIWHQKKNQFECHYCHVIKPKPLACAQCESKNLLLIGAGTERVEETLQEFFPDYKIARIDRDTTRRKDALKNLLHEVEQQQAQILLGTQMLAKGHHFPNVTLVAILNADHYLFCSDFRASERMAQLLLQVSGRAGRAEKLGHVYIQTHHPEHVFFKYLVNEGYNALSDLLLKERQFAKLPPFQYLALLHAESHQKIFCSKFLTEVKNKAEKLLPHSIQLLGPIPALHEKRAGKFRMQLLLQSEKRNLLQQFLKNLLKEIEELTTAKKVKWMIDVDPIEVG